MLLKLLVFLCLLQLVDSCRLRCRNITQCDDGWTYYKRNTTGWCMKIVLGSKMIINKTEGVAICAELGAVLSSIDDSAMEDVVFSLITTANIPYLAVTWIGATLKTECTSDECEKTDDNHCKQTETCGNNRYIWTDGYTTTQSDQFLDDEMKKLNWDVPEGFYYAVDSNCISYGKISACFANAIGRAAFCGKRSNI
ncbi:unnamed protein product [Caenorhabditis angaria]|uniref:C-type lectin domain-containing protein n=1 Tax=Caenorhabditis angaria TaxID=860376 RepID=A0A9P1I8B4_9PELO|nr:unnamed protein product [Caenorhabditis angaria]